MIGVDIIKQTLENNSNKEVSTNILKKLAKIKINDRFINCFSNYQINDIVERIIRSELSSEKQKELLIFYRTELIKCYEESKNTVEELFGKNKETENIATNTISNNYKELPEIEKKETPSEFTSERKEGQVVFNY